MTDHRAEFEAWATATPREFDVSRYNALGAWPGAYTEYHVHCAWEAWQHLSATIDALREENGRLRESLTEAIKSVAAWGSFANEYEQDRYRLSDEIVRLSAALEATK